MEHQYEKIEIFLTLRSFHILQVSKKKNKKMNTTTTIQYTTSGTVEDTIINNVKGVKELNEYINWISKIIADVSCELQEDLKQEKAMVRRNEICRDGPNFYAEMCVNAHKEFIMRMTELPEFSQYLNTKSILLESADQLENIRKILVSNKQQKKTAIRRIRKFINGVKSSTQSFDNEFDFVMPPSFKNHHEPDGEDLMDDDNCIHHEHESRATTGIDEPEMNESVEELLGLITMIKQNYRTFSKRVIETQVCPIIHALRTKHIVAYKLAAENTIGRIIYHAQKCRDYMVRCRWLALIEYCASSWWFETQKDPMDNSSYTITAEIVGDEDKIFNPNKQYAAFMEDLMNADICILVTSTQTEEPRGFSDNDDVSSQVFEARLAYKYELSRELAETILTEDAIISFENQQNDILIQQLQQEQEEEEEEEPEEPEEPEEEEGHL